MRIVSLSPWTVAMFLREVGRAARALDGARIGDWAGVANRCDRWEFCETKADRFTFAKEVAATSRGYASLGGAYCGRLAAYYRAVALAAFAGARGSRL